MIAAIARAGSAEITAEKSRSQELAIAPSPAPPEGRLLTLKQCRELGQVSRWTVWNWCNKGDLRTVEIGGVTRIRESDWLAFLQRHAKGNAEASHQ
jgi:predicted DNA-binding transcriptional regulator AlpA